MPGLYIEFSKTTDYVLFTADQTNPITTEYGHTTAQASEELYLPPGKGAVIVEFDGSLAGTILGSGTVNEVLITEPHARTLIDGLSVMAESEN